MPIIKNYGLRWSRNNVEWGSPGKGNEGKLNGIRASARSSKQVDFRYQMGIYVLYEPNYIPVYIGQAGIGNAKLFARLKTHQNNHLRDRWTHFSWFGFVGVDDNGELEPPGDVSNAVGLSFAEALGEIEGILIQVLEPRLNKQGPKWQQTADEYVQAGLAEERDLIYHMLLELEELHEKIDRLVAPKR